ncbi:hypothetical protein WDW37_16635 [Bdellovibrionota bacterium FG-1]
MKIQFGILLMTGSLGLVAIGSFTAADTFADAPCDPPQVRIIAKEPDFFAIADKLSGKSSIAPAILQACRVAKDRTPLLVIVTHPNFLQECQSVMMVSLKSLIENATRPNPLDPIPHGVLQEYSDADLDRSEVVFNSLKSLIKNNVTEYAFRELFPRYELAPATTQNVDQLFTELWAEPAPGLPKALSSMSRIYCEHFETQTTSAAKLARYVTLGVPLSHGPVQTFCRVEMR